MCAHVHSQTGCFSTSHLVSARPRDNPWSILAGEKVGGVGHLVNVTRMKGTLALMS